MYVGRDCATTAHAGGGLAAAGENPIAETSQKARGNIKHVTN